MKPISTGKVPPCGTLFAICCRPVPLRLCTSAGIRNTYRFEMVQDMRRQRPRAEITSPENFSASALPFSRRELNAYATPYNPVEWQTHQSPYNHSLELKPLAHPFDRTNGRTCVNFDLMQMGLGCVNSFGALPRPEYRIPANEYRFDFIISPVL